MNLHLLSNIIKSIIPYMSFLLLMLYNENLSLIISSDVIAISTMMMIHPKQEMIMKTIRKIIIIKKTIEFIIEKTNFNFIFGA
jgi:hypothetical protein